MARFSIYSGTGGRPAVSPARRYTGGDEFFVVGMAYWIRGQIQAADHERFYET